MRLIAFNSILVLLELRNAPYTIENPTLFQFYFSLIGTSTIIPMLVPNAPAFNSILVLLELKNIDDPELRKVFFQFYFSLIGTVKF
ncbi:hypothetical protein PFC_08095 [Pyrococcus furiosus COM1]|uniref:Uncharacterized protein n=1 Tax=Pyrococcus furiosus COM1 TaxID=1185654 RepID=I6URH8_9EURY|nr:hypothetical protein PFC_08095 [Pyrococcus furiosus COM1]